MRLIDPVRKCALTHRYEVELLDKVS
jgi:hypothetical protein